MKSISIFLITCFSALSISAQNMVTISVKGASINKIMVDSRYYSVLKDLNNQTTNAPIIITDLLPGQHSLKLLGTNAIENTSNNNTTFNLRSGYDLQIDITNNGSLQLKETLRIEDNDNQSKTPMTDVRFNVLYKNIKLQKASSARVVSINKAFTNSGNNFSTSQVKKLLQLVSSQISRLELAKTSYSLITDPENFSKLYILLYSKKHQDDLAAYVANYMDSNHDDSDHVAMDDASFNTIYQDVQQQWPVSSRLSYMINLFADESNHFTVLQARQLIELVNSESERLQLAKASYRNITDPANFTRMYEILASQSSRNELAAFVSSSAGNTNNTDNNGTTGMSDVNFNKIYQATLQQSTTTGRVNYLSNTFINANNYFSVTQARQLIQQVTGESYRLDLAKKSYRTIVDRENFTRIYDLLNTQASRNELGVYVNNYNSGNTGTKTALTATQFDALYRDIQNRSNSYRMTGLTDFFATATNYLNVAQAQQLIELVTIESDRLQLAKSSYDNIVDPANFSQLYNLFSTQSSRNELMAYVNNYNGEPTNTVRVPMTDANFNSLYRNIQFRFGIGAKMSSVTEVFANNNNYFTVAQAKQLIQLVSDESNRLQLAKSVYRNITNPENFNEMYDIFSNQAIKDELAAFVNANK